MALYIPHSIFHLARLLYVRPETSGPYYVHVANTILMKICVSRIIHVDVPTEVFQTKDPKQIKRLY